MPGNYMKKGSKTPKGAILKLCLFICKPIQISDTFLSFLNLINFHIKIYKMSSNFYLI